MICTHKIMNTHEETQSAGNLTETQKNELRGIFEPKYGHALSDQDLFEIHFNLKRFFMAVSKVS